MNLHDYIAWRGDLSFAFNPFNSLDAALFSQLSLLQLDKILVKDGKQLYMTIEEASLLLDDYSKKKQYSLGIIIPDDIIQAFIEMGKSARFKDLVIGNYVDNVSVDDQTQFSALTIDLDFTTRIVSFSGTDDSLIGWKENFNMLHVEVTPGQHLSCAYLEKVAKGLKKLHIVGHSKGGNLAIYSTLHSLPRIQRRIERVYAFDGPGLTEELDMIPDLEKNLPKITAYIPDTSVIGCLFEHPEKTLVVKSVYKGLYQHDLFSWEVMKDDFIYVEERTKESIHIEKKLKAIINKMDEHTKHTFVEVGYHILAGNETTTLTALYRDKLRVVYSFMKVDNATKLMFGRIFAELLADKTIRELVFNNVIKFTKDQRSKK